MRRMKKSASGVVATIFVVLVGVGLMPRESEAVCGAPTTGPTNAPPRTMIGCGCTKDGCAAAGTACNDNNLCTTGDVCDGKGACGGTPTICPSMPCATAACVPSTGKCASTNKPNGTRCGPGTCKNGSCDLTPVVR
jgi:hypothetical protein